MQTNAVKVVFQNLRAGILLKKSGAQSHINLYGSHLSHPYRYIQAQLAKIQVIIHSRGLTLEQNDFNKVLFYLW